MIGQFPRTELLRSRLELEHSTVQGCHGNYASCRRRKIPPGIFHATGQYSDRRDSRDYLVLEERLNAYMIPRMREKANLLA